MVSYAVPESVLGRSLQGPRSGWGVAEYLTAEIVDALHDANWQRGGAKGTRPERVQRPGSESNSHHFGSDPIPISEFNDWWDGA